jgi:60 kDa SS-A/Ro ribonucleoprotein
LGSEGGTYYIGEKELGLENAQCIVRLLADGKGMEVIQEIVAFSEEGRAAKQNPIIFALAMCARDDNVHVKRAAYESLPRVCRIPTYLFAFVEFCEKLSIGTGWGRAHRRGVQGWYNEKGAEQLAMAVTKYRQRDGWSHLDLARLSHIKPSSEGVDVVIRYVVKGLDEAQDVHGSSDDLDIQRTLAFLRAVEEMKNETSEEKIAQMIREHSLVREHVPTNQLNSVVVWDALLSNMPMMAMIRNLGKMSAIGLLAPLSDQERMVCDRLRDDSALKKARIHPFNVLVALRVYERGTGDKGKLKWKVNQNIVDSLDDAFYKSFKFVKPTGKRFLLAIDVSGSMRMSYVNGSSSIDASTAAAAMAMVTARCEQTYHFLGFSSELVQLGISHKMRLDKVVETMSRIPMGATDCAKPMEWAKTRRALVDIFIVYTDSETWFGSVHPSQALKDYRKEMRIDAKLIVCGMTSNGFTIADPNDAGMLDMVGFDSAAPEVIRNFALGNI